MAEYGEWLNMGGRSSAGFGKGYIEVRVATGDLTWEWRTLSDHQVQQLLRYANSKSGQSALGFPGEA